MSFWLPILVSVVVVTLVWLQGRRKYLRAEQVAREQAQHLQQTYQNQLLEAQSRQLAIFNSMSEALLLLDAAGRVQMANRAFAEIFGVTADVRGRTILEALRHHELAGLLSRLDTEKQFVNHELRVTTPQERWLEVNGASIFEGEQRLGSVFIFHDVTWMKQIEAARKDFVANVSHELRTPLSLINGYVETLLGGAKDDPETNQRFLSTIQRNSQRLGFLIEDLLTISELESGRVNLRLQRSDLREIAQKVLEDLGSRASGKRMKLSNQLPAIAIDVDAPRIEQVFSNLVDNAIKYGNPGGLIVLGGTSGPAEAQVFVEDDGPGIQAEAVPRVFERFYRVDKARSREHGGTGLGLAIVKHIVVSHGGTVWVESQLGKGSVFHFSLPALGTRSAGGA